MSKTFIVKGARCLLFTAVCLVFFACATSPLSLPFICTSSPVPPSTPIEVNPYFAGVSHAGFTRTQREFDLMNHLGIQWTQRSFAWGRLEPVQGEWDFIEFDDFVNKNIAAGVRIVATLAYDTWWLHDDFETRRNITPDLLPYFLNYVRTVVTHFAGRVDAWKIWNEPNFSRFWRGTDEDFFELTLRTAEIIREIDSEALIIAGSFNRNIFGRNQGLPESMIRGLFASGAMEIADFIAFHPYEMNPARVARLFQHFRSVVADYGFDDRMWVTEMGFPTGGRYPTRIRERNLPGYLIQTKVLLLAGGAEKIIWYQLFDPHSRNRRNSENFFGIVRSNRDHTSKGSEAFRLVSTYLSGTTFYAQVHDHGSLPRSLRTFWFHGTDHNALVFWNEGGSRRVRLQLPGTGHRLHDIVTGEASSMEAETVIRTGRTPVFITWQESQDKPVITGR